MAKKFYAQKDALGFPIPGTMMSVEAPTNIPKDSIRIPAENVVAGSGQSVVKQPSGLRYFVRKNERGEIIPNSLTISLQKPQGYVYEFKKLRNSVVSEVVVIPVPFTCTTLGNAASFAVLGATTVTNTGTSVVTGNLGLYAGTSVTGFPPGTIVGTQEITTTAANNAKIDAQAAFTAFNAKTPTGSVVADIGGTTILPGIYSVSSSLAITGTVILDAQGDENAVFIFQIPSTFIPADSAIVTLANSAKAGNVYWIVGSSATLSTSSNTKGNIIASASVTLNTSAQLTGRAIALTGAVTMDTNTITTAVCTANPLA